MAKPDPLAVDVDDLMRDVALLPLAVTGGWIKILGRLHHAPERGSLSLSLNEWASLMGCSKGQAETVLKTLLSKRICDGKFTGDGSGDGSVTVESRRMIRERDTLTLKRLRQERYQEKKKKGGVGGETQDEWLADLRRIYDHVDFDFELKKAQRWITDHPGRQLTKKFFMNWLGKVPRPLLAVTTNGTLSAAEAWMQVEEMRQGKRAKFTHVTIAQTTRAIGGIFAGDITTTQLDVKRGQFLKMFPDIYAAARKETP